MSAEDGCHYPHLYDQTCPGCITLPDFLLARIAEKERRAPRKHEDFYGRPCPRCGLPVSGLGSPLDDEAVLALHPHDQGGLGCPLSLEQWQTLMPDLGPTADGAQVLAECEAMRRIVEQWRAADTAVDEYGGEGDGWPEIDRLRAVEFALTDTLRFLALAYVDHPDHRKEWKP